MSDSKPTLKPSYNFRSYRGGIYQRDALVALGHDGHAVEPEKQANQAFCVRHVKLHGDPAAAQVAGGSRTYKHGHALPRTTLDKPEAYGSTGKAGCNLGDCGVHLGIFGHPDIVVLSSLFRQFPSISGMREIGLEVPSLHEQ